MLSSQMQACSVIVIIVFDLITIRAEVSCHGRSRYVRFFLIDTVLDVIHRSKMGGTSASSWCRRSCVREQTRTGREITSTRLPEEPPPPPPPPVYHSSFFPRYLYYNQQAPVILHENHTMCTFIQIYFHFGLIIFHLLTGHLGLENIRLTTINLSHSLISDN